MWWQTRTRYNMWWRTRTCYNKNMSSDRYIKIQGLTTFFSIRLEHLCLERRSYAETGHVKALKIWMLYKRALCPSVISFEVIIVKWWISCPYNDTHCQFHCYKKDTSHMQWYLYIQSTCGTSLFNYVTQSFTACLHNGMGYKDSFCK